METKRVAVGTGLMIALIAGAGLPGVSSTTVQFEATGTVTGWEAVLNYDVNASWTNITDYWVDGDFSDVIVCDVDWVLVTEETTSTDRENLVQYALDYDEGEFGYLQVKNGSQTKKVAVCSSFSLNETKEPQHEWHTTLDCKSPGPTEGESGGTGAFLPLVYARGPSETVPDEEAGHCIKVWAATASSGYIPYTGSADAVLESSDGDLHNRVRITTVGGYLPTVQSGFAGEDSDACGQNCQLVGTDGPFEGLDIPGAGHMAVSAET